MAKLSDAQVAAAAHIGGWTGENQIVTATAVALAESGGDPTAKGGPNSNGTFDWGLFQLNDVHNPTDAEKSQTIPNAQRAYKIWVAAGHSFKPWATYNNGNYKKFITNGQIAYGRIHSDPSVEERLKKGDTDSHFGEVNEGSPIDNVGGALEGGINALSKTIFGAVTNLAVVGVAVVLLILGVVILLRGPVSAVAGKTALGKVAKTAKKVS
jgi:Lysozyme like domain